MPAVLYLIVINVIAFLAFGLDKMKAKQRGARRIPEKTLLGLALAGGSVGAWLGMQFFRHKTLHPQFKIGIPVIFLCQIGLLALLGFDVGELLQVFSGML